MKNLIFATSCNGSASQYKFSNNLKKAIVSPFCSLNKKYSSSQSCLVPRLSSAETGRTPHRFKNWQQLRQQKLTASTFAMAVGFRRGRRVQLWLEKLGQDEPFTGNNATDWSNKMEEEALKTYKLITGNTVSFPEFQVYWKNPGDNWLAASADACVSNLVYGLASHGVLEIKCPFIRNKKIKPTPWKRIPLFYMPQAQGLMEILDRDWLDLYVWTVNGSNLFRLYRDVEYWYALKIALSDFWWKHVQPAKELYSKYTITDATKQLEMFCPAPRHELCNYLLYESKRLVDSSILLWREPKRKLQT